MNLTNQFPRSPYDMMADIVMLPRTLDKCRAHLAGTLGEYHYNCPMDVRLFEFLSTDSEAFAEKVKELQSDEKIAEWVNKEFQKSKEEKDQFNNSNRHKKPEDEDSKNWLEEQKKSLGRDDYSTFFDNIDADEKRF
jgi:hypothetical protein